MPRDFKTILCPTDFSETSFHALDYGLRFARNASGTLIVMHVIHVPSGDLYGETRTLHYDEARQRIEQRMVDVVANRLQGYPKAQTRIEVGEPAEHVIKMAKECRADLIVISTHGRSAWSQLAIGSVADKIIHHAPCPVFVVRSGVE